MRLTEHSYTNLAQIRGPLLFLEKVCAVRMGESVLIEAPDGSLREGEVLHIDGENVMVQIFGESRGLSLDGTRVRFSDSVRKAPLSEALLGRVCNGSGVLIDGKAPVIPDRWAPVIGAPLNPAARARPRECIETGFSSIDVLNTLVRGQKLPIFSSAGLPSQDLVAALLEQARMPLANDISEQKFAVVFVALGLTHHEYAFYMQTLERLETPCTAYINLANDAVLERLLAPRFALTYAEYLAFSLGYDVLVIIADMTNYCDALREVATAREELPGRRGYPGYMYSDLASIYERAGRIKGSNGSITQLPVLTMPENDITHPVPDLTGYITEGQLVLSADLHRRGIFPPIDILPSLSRLMQQGIGAGQTRADHRKVANSLYRNYAKGCDLRNLEAIVGRDGLSKDDQLFLDYAEQFEQSFIHQENGQRRQVGQSLDIGLKLNASLKGKETA
ncbi:MAG: V-type ATP synthase subunit B [Desulfuromonas sp.]|nr:MAG: V-type ATP synthase subunit B [Desulfuromonas sp.]